MRTSIKLATRLATQFPHAAVGTTLEARQDLRDTLFAQTGAALCKALAPARRAGVTRIVGLQAHGEGKAANAAVFGLALPREAGDRFGRARRRLENGNVHSRSSRAGDAQDRGRAADLAAVGANYPCETKRLVAVEKRGLADR